MDGGVIGCKQFSCSGDAVWRLVMGCRRMLCAWDRAAIMAGVNAGLSALHNWGCSWGLNPPVSWSARVM